ncbi:MAG: EAL domain-containing protein [Methylophilaceae bacterium]
MKVGYKLMLIVVTSVFVVTIPAVWGIYHFTSERLLAREITTLVNETGAIVRANSARLEAVNPVLRSVSRMLQESLSAPPKAGEEAAFDYLVQQDQDHAWRSRHDRFDGKHEAGLFLPPDAPLDAAQKRLHLRTKNMLDRFDLDPSWRFGNLWLLTSGRSEIIFDVGNPDFVHAMSADTDYTNTPWFTLGSPSINPKREMRWTPPLYDLPSKLWMVSAIRPVDVQGKWIGTVGQDLNLADILSFLLRPNQRYHNEQHFMRDAQGNYILAGPWQKTLEQKTENFRPDLDDEPALAKLLDTKLTDNPKLVAKKVNLGERPYIAVGILMQPTGWRYIRLIPYDEILAPVRQQTLTLAAAILVMGLLIGLLIEVTVRRNIIVRLKQLASTVRQYGTGNLNARALVSGNDEIAATAHDFNTMANSFAQQREVEMGLMSQYLDAQIQLEATLNAIPDILFEMGLDGRYHSYHSPRTNLLAAAPQDFIGKTVFEVLPEEAAAICMTALREANRDGMSNGLQFSIALTESTLWFELSVSRKPAVDNQEPHFIVLSRDISERKQAESDIHALAFYDSLTRTPNRRLLMDRLQQSMIASGRTNEHVGLLFIDLDNFKTLNDTKGHDVGDLLLIEIANRLQTCVRESDTVSRLGGDEFVVILNDLNTEVRQAVAQTELVGEKILTAIHRVCLLREEEYHSSASIGISLFSGHDISIEETLKRADTAMYQAKQAGRNTLRFFDPAMQIALEARLALENGLRHAITKQQFVLYYQMQVDHTGKTLGAEVLVRWQHPEHGLISPDKFIPLSEETGLILQIGHWVITIACAQLKLWEIDPRTAHLQLAVNVSARQFQQPGFVDEVMAVLKETGANPFLLKLELTESAVLDDIENTIAKMTALKAIGVRFSVDDFGTGHSSLAYLTRLPLDQLKIDQSFVRNIGIKPTDAVIVRTIIGMAENLGMEVIAEGVETGEQHEFLIMNGCLMFQGYLFGKPIAVNEFEDKLEFLRA